MILTINNKDYQGFTQYTINIDYNSMASTFSFQSKNNIFQQPLSYPKIQIKTNEGKILLTGTILLTNYSSSSEPEQIKLSGYSTAGILGDVNIPVSLYPLQFDNLSLKQIIDKIFPVFEIDYIIESSISSEINKSFEKVTASESETVGNFITKLAVERGIFVTNDELGRVIFKRVDIKKLIPVAFFKDGQTGFKNGGFPVNGQQMFSDITVMRQASDDNPDAGEFTIKNPYIEKFRPRTKILSSGNLFDVKTAARMELSKDLRAMPLIFNTTKLILPGNLVSIQSKELNIIKPSEFFVESVIITGNKTDENYSLNCTLKDVYTDTDPINIFK